MQIEEHFQPDPAAGRDTPTGSPQDIRNALVQYFQNKYVASTNIWINVKVLNIVNYLLIVSQLNLMLQIERDNETSAWFKS